MVPCGDTVAHRQSQAGTFLLGGEKRGSDLIHIFGMYAPPLIANAEVDRIILAIGFDSQDTPARRPHGFNAVAGQVHYQLAELGRIDHEYGDVLQVQFDATEITLKQGERPVLQYRYTDVPFKPYVRALYSPSGLNVLRDAPPDHLHHHGLMFAVAVNDIHFWAEDNQAGGQKHSNTSVDVRDDLAAFSGLVGWHVGNKVLLREYRRITVLHAPPGVAVNLITWRSQLMPDTEATLTGHHYYGLGMRFAASMDQSGTFINAAGAEGEVFRGDERLTQANWCAYTAEVDGQPVTVAMFDHPKNIRPVTWFTMKSPFAYLSATLRYHDQPLKLERGNTPDLYYGVAVWDGRVDSDRIEQVYQHWLQNTQIAQPARSDEQ